MKKFIMLTSFLCVVTAVNAQAYPETEFTNEVSYFKKDDAVKIIRLEKNTSKIETKTKLGGFGGFEYGYVIEGEKSLVRLNPGSLSFIYSTSGTAQPSSTQADSIMKAHGLDPATVAGMTAGMNDPSKSIALYKVENAKGSRKILIQKSGGAIPFAGKKTKSSDKYSFSVKKIKDGYWELVVDKPLGKGEYAFTTSQALGSMDGGTTVFAFGID
ncbi:MAG: hypothetical protein ABI863_14270 [Ginsengibacter sp.]